MATIKDIGDLRTGIYGYMDIKIQKYPTHELTISVSDGTPFILPKDSPLRTAICQLALDIEALAANKTPGSSVSYY